MKTLDDIRHDKDLQSQIHWDMEPRKRIQRTLNETQEEMEQLEKQLRARVGYYFYIDVQKHNPALYLYQNYPDGSGKFVVEVIEIPEQMLHEALREAGGSMNIDGRYPVNATIKTWLQNRLNE
jgi:hypothetical protein